VISAHLVGDEQLLQRLRELHDTINAGLARCITQLGIDLQRNVQQNKLSGQVLKTRTGALKSSIDRRVDQSARGASTNVFTEIRYGTAQEYGFAGTVSVGASLRRIRQVFGRPIAEKTISVRAYDRRMSLPERSFLRSALEDMTPAIGDAINAVVAEAISNWESGQ
jgi:Bacteriophage HK97-gp10, putative tail-component